MSSELPHGVRNDLSLYGTSVSLIGLALGQGGLDHRISLGIACHGGHWRPVAGLAASASRIARAGLLIEPMTTRK
jgi:hypothetical protein